MQLTLEVPESSITLLGSAASRDAISLLVESSTAVPLSRCDGVQLASDRHTVRTTANPNRVGMSSIRTADLTSLVGSDDLRARFCGRSWRATESQLRLVRQFLAELAELPAEPAPADIAAAPAPTPGAPATSHGAQPVAGEAQLRRNIDSKRGLILGCTSNAAVIVELRLSGGTLTGSSVRGSAAGTPAEGCVQAVLSGIQIPAGATGTVLHAVE